MTDSAFVSTLTPQQRLENTRNALVRHMRRGEERDPSRLAEERESPDDLPRPGEGKWNAFKRAMRAWWHHHPANVALDVARPLLGEYTKGHPLKVLGIAAGVGAAAVFLKPWRLISLGGLLLAAMKSSDITGVVLSVLTPEQETDPSRQTP